MKDKTFIKLLLIIMAVGVVSMAALLIYGFNLLQTISMVEMIANWG